MIDWKPLLLRYETLLHPDEHGLALPIGFVLAVTLQGCDPKPVSLGVFTTSVAGGSLGQRGGTAGGSGTASGGGGGGVAGASGAGWTLGPFASPRALESLLGVGAVTTDPSVTEDGLAMFMMSTRGGNKDLWASKRATTSSEWGAPVAVAELNSDAVESNANLSHDGLSVWFYTDRERSIGTLWSAHRTSRAESFGTPEPIAGICDTSASDIAATMDGPQRVVVFASMRLRQTQGYDLFEARRTSPDSAFDAPTLIAEVNGATDDFDPFLSVDGLTLLFHSNRSGNEDLFWSHRESLTAPFSVPLPLGNLNGAAADVAPTLALSGAAIWFASTRDGDERVYEATASQE